MSRAVLAAFLWVLVLPAAALAQTPATSASPPLGSRVWLAAGFGFSAARAGCASCGLDGVSTHSRSLLIDAGLRTNPRVDVGIELLWADLRVDGTVPIRTTFVLGVAQFRPWVNHGLFLRAGVGIGIAGNGLRSPIDPEPAPPYTTNALAITYGTGWVFQLTRRWALQVHAAQYVAALGELRTTTGTSMKNVVGNYWTIGTAIVFR